MRARGRGMTWWARTAQKSGSRLLPNAAVPVWLSSALRFFETSSVRPAPRPRRGPPRPRHAAPLPTRDAGVPDILQLAAGGSIRARTRVAGAARRDGRLTAAACRSQGSPVTPLFLIGSIN